VVDAETGSLIWRAVGGAGAASATTFQHPDLVDSMSSTVAVLDSDGNGVHDRFYVGDTGGNVWRGDIAGTDTSDWKLSLLAVLGRHSVLTPAKIDDRRFHHRPDVVQGVDDSGPYDAVIIGSGDRPDPLDKGGVVYNWMYMIKDRNIAPNSGVDVAYGPSSFGDVTSACIDIDVPCTADLSNGWRLQLAATGEKSLSTPITIGGTIFFTTYLPPGAGLSLTCAPSEGTGRIYAVRLSDAAAVRDYDTSTDEPERYAELNSLGIPAEVVSLPPDSILRPDLSIEHAGTPTRFETYWFEAEE
jgi:type IV pilus assembly protein PilY1